MSADDSTVRGSWPGGYRGAGSTDMLGWRWRVCVGLRDTTKYELVCVTRQGQAPQNTTRRSTKEQGQRVARENGRNYDTAIDRRLRVPTAPDDRRSDGQTRKTVQNLLLQSRASFVRGLHCRMNAIIPVNRYYVHVVSNIPLL